MLDLRRIRQEPDVMNKLLARRSPSLSVNEILTLDARRLELLKQTETLRAERNQLNRDMGAARKTGDTTKADDLLEASRAISQQLDGIEAEMNALDAQQTELLMTLPNPPLPEVPTGADEHDNVILRAWGDGLKDTRIQAVPQPQAHWDLATSLGLVDFERGVKLAKSRFSVYTGHGARLVRALMAFMLELHTTEHGYQEIWPPYLVNRTAMTGTGQLPKFEDDLFKCQDDPELFLIPTAEVPLTNLYANEILDNAQLPIQMTAYTPCFRREAGAAGRDTRGLLRQHQFDKVELVHITRPEDSQTVHEQLIRHAETVLERLELPYRSMLLCTGDMGFGAARCIDLEVWMPGQGCYREISSCSNFLDFQARRMGLKFRRNAESKPEFCHTLNGSGLAIGRTFAALLENYQQPDGSVVIPKALQPYLGGLAVLNPLDNG